MQRINEPIAIFGLFAVSLTAWGPNVFGSQAFMMCVVAMVAIACMTEDIVVAAFGAYCALWFAYIQFSASMGFIPREAIIQAVDTMQLIMAGIVWYLFVRGSKVSPDLYMDGICVLSVILSIIALIQVLMGGVPTATLANQNFLAAFLAISTVFFFRGRWQWALPLIIMVLYLCKTSTAVLAICVGIGFYFYGWKGTAAAIIPAGLYFLIIKTPTSLHERIGFWADAFNKVSTSWQTLIFGVGPGIYWQPGNMLHSEYVYLLFNFGIIGLVLALLYILGASKRNRFIYSAFLVCLVDGIGNHLLHTAPTAMLATTIFALNDREV